MEYIPEKYKGHFVFKDLYRHPDYSWYIQPVGFVSSILLFPSLLFCGMFTTIQESALLDLKLSLKNHDKANITTRMMKMDDYQYRLMHTATAVDFVKRMAQKDFIKELCPKDSTESEHMSASMFYYERYLASAISKELYYRNPLKYDSEYPTTAMVGKIIVGGIGTALITSRFPPAFSLTTDAVLRSDATEKAQLSACDAAKDVISNKFCTASSFVNKRKPLMAILGLANVAKIIDWGMETRK